MQAIGQMMRKAAGVTVLALLATGCSSIRDHRGYLVDQPLVDAIQPGVDNQLSVEKTLGRPTFVSQFGQPSWYYVSINTAQAAFTRPRTSDQMILRVRFDAKGNVLAVDRSGIEKVVRLNPNGDETPTLGRERGFFEDLFGNIGTVGGAGLPGGGSTGPGPGSGPNGS